MTSLKNLYIISILILFISHKLNANKLAKNKISVRELDPNVPQIQPIVCGKLCDSAKIDALTAISFESEPNNYILIVRSACSWNLDIKNPTKVSPYGHRHQFTFNEVEAIFTIFEDKTFNISVIFTSGMSADIFKYNGQKVVKVWTGASPLPGLEQDFTKPIDAIFEWHETKTIYLIQGSNYFVYDMANMKQLSGPQDFYKDFGLNPTESGQIDASFTLGKKIYFFTAQDFYIYSVESQNRANGKISGSLGTKQSTQSLFFRCTANNNSLTTPSEESNAISDGNKIVSSIPMIAFTFYIVLHKTLF